MEYYLWNRYTMNLMYIYGTKKDLKLIFLYLETHKLARKVHPSGQPAFKKSRSHPISIRSLAYIIADNYNISNIQRVH